jgi:hypothetical protein
MGQEESRLAAAGGDALPRGVRRMDPSLQRKLQQGGTIYNSAHRGAELRRARCVRVCV